MWFQLSELICFLLWREDNNVGKHGWADNIAANANQQRRKCLMNHQHRNSFKRLTMFNVVKNESANTWLPIDHRTKMVCKKKKGKKKFNVLHKDSHIKSLKHCTHTLNEKQTYYYWREHARLQKKRGKNVIYTSCWPWHSIGCDDHNLSHSVIHGNAFTHPSFSCNHLSTPSSCICICIEPILGLSQSASPCTCQTLPRTGSHITRIWSR